MQDLKILILSIILLEDQELIWLCFLIGQLIDLTIFIILIKMILMLFRIDSILILMFSLDLM